MELDDCMFKKIMESVQTLYEWNFKIFVSGSQWSDAEVKEAAGGEGEGVGWRAGGLASTSRQA